jgi:type II secretory pathway pseudopilin PulG
MPKPTGYRVTRTARKVAACLTAVLLLVFLSYECAAQSNAAGAKPASTVEKYPGLPAELGRLLERLKREVQIPPARYESHLVPLLPAGTTYVIASPNFGEAAHQSLAVFHDELKQSSVLNDWWHGEMAQSGPQLEDAIEKFYQISSYLGDEIVVSGDIQESKQASNRAFLLLAEVKKPGLAEHLRQLFQSIPDKSRPKIRILNPRELPAEAAQPEGADLVVLVRPDFVIAARDVDAVASFNALLDAKSHEFASTPFGQRLAQAYQAGAEAVGGADLQTILSRQVAGNPTNKALLDRSGFGDLKYLVWNSRMAGEEAVSESELSFTGPRHGAAAWLASPGAMPSLDFVSPNGFMVASLLLKNFGEIYDDIKGLSNETNPNASATVSQMERAMQVNLRDDLLSKFPGELTFELNGVTEKKPVWNVILRVNDAQQVQKTLDKLLAAQSARTVESEDSGTTYYTVIGPPPQKTGEVTYAFVDGYMVIASSRETAMATVGVHKSGESVVHASVLQAPLPSGYSSEVSALFYESLAAIVAAAMRQATTPAAIAAMQVSPILTTAPPVVMRAYGEDTVIRGLTVGTATDPSVMMMVAAIAIPNLLGARIAANESAAVGSLRAVNAAQATYAAVYSPRRYAPDLASLGPDPRGRNFRSPEHARLLDNILGNSSCTAGKWCDKTGYRFTLSATCKLEVCSEFVVLATPLHYNSGSRSFCSTSDGVIRYRSGAPLDTPIAPSECRSWTPVQ